MAEAQDLCVSFPGVFITHGDVGVGTIVGSAVFNILCIIGVCGLFAGQVSGFSLGPADACPEVWGMSLYDKRLGVAVGTPTGQLSWILDTFGAWFWPPQQGA